MKELDMFNLRKIRFGKQGWLGEIETSIILKYL